MRTFRFVSLLALASAAVASQATVIDFEGLADRSDVGGQISGLTFTNATIFTSPNYNDSGYPPHSGVNVVVNSGDPISISFSTATSSVGAWISSPGSVTLSAYSGSTLVGTALGGGSYGSNSFLEVSGANITSVTFSSGFGSYYLTLDDLTFTANAVPGPMAALPFALMALRRRKRA